jgi:DNA-damage-inducible protein D
VRAALNNSGIFPERLAAAEDIRKVERRIKSEEKRLMSGAQKLIKPDEPDPTP